MRDAGARVDVRVPAIDDAVRLAAERVARFRAIRSPKGAPAVEFVVSDDDGVRPLILVSDDVVCAPVDAREVLDSSMVYAVSDSPGLVAHSEMTRDAEALARACAGSGPKNVSGLAGSFLLLRCCIVGATRFGLRPVRAVAWWQRAWHTIGGDLPLPPFRSDARWEELVRRAAESGLPSVPSDGPQQDGPAAGTDALCLEDFQRTAPALTFTRLDDAFLTAWKAHVRIAPGRLAEALLDGVEGGRARVALYPDGGGSIDVRVESAGSVHAVLQLRFPVGGEELAVDEVRIAEGSRGAGLFQRLMYNAEEVGRLLGVRAMTLHATDAGGYALATLGAYPRDPALRDATDRDAASRDAAGR